MRFKSKSHFWIAALFLALITIHANAITTFTVNGQTEIELRPDQGELRFIADTGRPGGTLRFELYIDANGDGLGQPEIDTNLFEFFGQTTITDGGDGYPTDEDGVANGTVSWTVEAADFLPGFSGTGFILRAVDEDGSSAEIVVHTIIPELNQSISGRVVSETGAPIPGVVVMALRPDIIFPEPPIPLSEEVEPSVPDIDLPDDFPVLGGRPSVNGGGVDAGTFAATPIFTVTDADGNYRLPTEAGGVWVRIFPRLGYYIPGNNAKDIFRSEGMVSVEVAPNEHKTGVDFTLAEDHIPPTIEHTPPTETALTNSAVTLRARIIDDESGVDPYGISGFGFGGPTVFFRPVGGAAPFERRMMYPAFGGETPRSIPLPTTPGAEGGGIDLPSPPIVFPEFDNVEAFEATLSGPDISSSGVEYYIEAADRAGNATTHPIDAPARLHRINVSPSDFIISGRVRTPEGDGVANVELFAFSFNAEREFSETRTVSQADGTYALHLPSSGVWEVSIAPPYQFYFADPGQSSKIVEVVLPREYGGNDFVLVRDVAPPVIEHDPRTDITATSIGEDVEIRAKVTDDSGLAFAYLVWFPTGEETTAADDVIAERLPIGGVPEVENGADWTFHIPGSQALSDFVYYIEAYDIAGNTATAPPDGRSNPYRVTLAPARYRIVGQVTDETGNPIDGVNLSFSLVKTDESVEEPFDPSGGYRYTQTDAEGRFSVPVKPGVWEVVVHRPGFSLLTDIPPVVVETEGEYPLNITLGADDAPPTIVHQPRGSYMFGEPIVVEAQVADNRKVRSVVLGIFHRIGDGPDGPPVVIYDEDGERVEGIGEGKVEPDAPPIFPPIFDDLDFPIDIKPPEGGYFEYLPMLTTDGATYRADLADYLSWRGRAFDDELRYIIRAVDMAGNSALSPENAPEEIYTVPMIVPQTISGTVAVDGEPLAYAFIVLLGSGGTVRASAVTEADGSYQLPAFVGLNVVSLRFHSGYRVVFPESGEHEATVEAGRHIEGINFQLTPQPIEPPGPEVPDFVRLDLNTDGSVNIFDLVMVGGAFSKRVEELNLAEGAPNPDVNDDGVVDIFDLVRVAQRFGQAVSGAASGRQLSPIDVVVKAVPLARSDSSATIGLQLQTDFAPAGMQFDLALHSPQARLLSVEKGGLLDSHIRESFWRSPEIRDNVAVGAINVALAPESARQSEQFAVVSIGFTGDVIGCSAALQIENLVFVDAEGRGALAQVEPIHLDLEALVQPSRDRLLQNYPNPFNPETWIPFQLAREANVQIQVYDASGRLVRTLDVGHRPAGLYAGRSRAAYWDGANDIGERVASGVYFYAIQAGDYHDVRRMVILK